MEHKNDLGKLFNDRLAQVEVAPEKSVWPEIEKTLVQKRRKRLYYIWFGAFVGVLAGVLALTYLFTDQLTHTESTNTLDYNKNQPGDKMSKTLKEAENLQNIELLDSTAATNYYKANSTTLPILEALQSDSDTAAAVSLRTTSNPNLKIKKLKEDPKLKKERDYKIVVGQKAHKQSVGINSKKINTKRLDHPLKYAGSVSISNQENVENQSTDKPEFPDLAKEIVKLKPSEESLENSKSTYQIKNSDSVVGEVDHRLNISRKSTTNKFATPAKRTRKAIKALASDSTQRTQRNLTTKNIERLLEEKLIEPVISNLVSVVQNDSLTKTLANTRQPLAQTMKDSTALVTSAARAPNAYHLYPFVGISGFGSFSDESSIDRRLNNNEKTTKPQMSYGLLALFEINKKIRLRSGVVRSKIQLSTADVIVDPINRNTNYENIIYAENLSYGSFLSRFTEQEEITFIEQLTYLEVPLELSYCFLNDKKLSLSAIGGLGFQWLTKNELFYQRNHSNSQLLGENSAYLQSSAGLHLGVSLDYQLSKSVQLHFESIFKPKIAFYNGKIGNTPFIYNLHLGLMYQINGTKKLKNITF